MTKQQIIDSLKSVGVSEEIFTDAETVEDVEYLIVENPAVSYLYLTEILKERNEVFEVGVLYSPKWSTLYSVNVIGGRWERAEERIATSPQWALYYSDNAIDGRFPACEAAMYLSDYMNEYNSRNGLKISEMKLEEGFCEEFRASDNYKV